MDAVASRRRSDLERSSDINKIIDWHLSGFSRGICSALAQSHFGISRQQANRDYAIAMDTLHKEDEPQQRAEPVTLEVRDATVNLLQLAILKAQEEQMEMYMTQLQYLDQQKDLEEQENQAN